MLGAQVLLGFQYSACFQPRFPQVPAAQQYLWLATLAAMLVSLALLLSPVVFDRVCREDQRVERFEQFVTIAAALALLPFAVSLGTDLYIAASNASARAAAPALGALGTTMALVWWYGIGGWKRMSTPRREPEPEDSMPAGMKDKIQNVLTEARTVLPGAQALLGFQFVVVLSKSFEQLPAALQQLHVATLALTALSTLLLIAPAAYHRIADGGEFTEDTLRFGSRAVVAALVPLALGLCGELFLVTWQVTKSGQWAAGLSSGILVVFAIVWLAVPLLVARRKTHRRSTRTAPKHA